MYRFKCDGQEIACTSRPIVAEGYVDTNEASFEFCKRWEGLDKVAQFTQTQDGKRRTFNAVIQDGIAKMPNELRSGRVLVSAFAVEAGGTKRLTTIPVEIMIEKSGFVQDGETQIPPPPDLYAQLILQIKEAMQGGVSDEQIAEAVKNYLDENPVGVDIDKTLTVEGSAADAKATGEKITSLSTEIKKKIDETQLQNAVNSALEEAKNNGDFDGETGSVGPQGPAGDNGYTPIKGVDYFTEADKAELVSMLKKSLTVETWTFELEDGSTVEKAVLLS